VMVIGGFRVEFHSARPVVVGVRTHARQDPEGHPA
jgi:hypothetical protein